MVNDFNKIIKRACIWILIDFYSIFHQRRNNEYTFLCNLLGEQMIISNKMNTFLIQLALLFQNIFSYLLYDE